MDFNLSDLVSKESNTLEVDGFLWFSGSMDKGAALFVCHFLKLATDKGTYPNGAMTAMTKHYARMVWQVFCVHHVGKALRMGSYLILLSFSNLYRFQGLQALVILASLVS